MNLQISKEIMNERLSRNELVFSSSWQQLIQPILNSYNHKMLFKKIVELSVKGLEITDLKF